MFDLGWDEGGVEVETGIMGWGGGGMVEECRSLLLTFVLHVDIDDVWAWILDPSTWHTVRGAYRTVTYRTPSNKVNSVSVDLLCLGLS